MRLTPLTVAAFAIIAVELPTYTFSGDIACLKRPVFPVLVTILSLVLSMKVVAATYSSLHYHA